MGAAAHVLREIWVARFQAVFQGIPIKDHAICMKIIVKCVVYTQFMRSYT